MRLLRPPAVITGGSVTYHGRRVAAGGVDVLAANAEQLRALRWREIAIVFQSAMNSLNPVLRVRDQLLDALGAHLALTREQRHDRIVELIEMVGIPRARLASYPHELSGGMRQRVMIAMALAAEPEVVIMDEPTTALDVVVQRDILAEIFELKDALGFSVLFITHDLSLLLEIADRVVIMYAGQVVESGTREEIHRRAAHPYTRGLLTSFPRLSGPRVKLSGIPGSPPDLRGALAGCPFVARCGFATDACETVDMALSAGRARPPERVPVRERGAGQSEPVAAAQSARQTTVRWRSKPSTSRSVTGSDATSRSTPSAASRWRCGAARSPRWWARAAPARRRWRACCRARSAAPAGRSCSTARRSTPPHGAAFAPTRERCRWSSRTRSPRSTRCTRCAITSSARLRLHGERTGCEAGQDELDRLLGQVRLSPPEQFRDAYPHELSGGQRQRVAIARALAASPRVLLADEPVSMLDVSIRLEMLDLIEELRARLDLAVLYITHDIASARYFADEILVMHDGEIVERGPAEQVTQAPSHEYTRLLIASAPDPDAFGRQLRVRREDRTMTLKPAPPASPGGT